jgi:alkylated DNA repair dioxygenase AlkB
MNGNVWTTVGLVKTLQITEGSYITLRPLPEEMKAVLDQAVVELTPELIYRPAQGFNWGKHQTQPRSVRYFSDVTPEYKYGTNAMLAKPLTPALKVIQEWVNAEFNANNNGCLANSYATGLELINPHQDNEKKVNLTNGVVSISWGEVRSFRVTDGSTKKDIVRINTQPYEVMEMGGDQFQKKLFHGIPKQANKGRRVSLTFRELLA